MKNVIFIGDVALDEYYKAEYLPKLGEKISVESLDPQLGGMIANAASVFASYAPGVDFCGVVNEGAVTQQLIKGFQDYRVNTDCLVYQDIPDSKVIIILVENEHTVFIPNLGIEELRLSEALYERLMQKEWIYSNIHEIKLLRYRDYTAHEIIEEFKANGGKLFFDLDVADFRPGEREYLKYIDVLCVNEIGYENLRTNMVLAEFLASENKPLIVKTLGPNGVRVKSAEEEFHLPGIKVSVEDVTGAGDTFCSSLFYGLLKKLDLRRAVSFANHAAARSVTGIGARYGAVGVETVLAFMEERGVDLEEYQLLLSGKE